MRGARYAPVGPIAVLQDLQRQEGGSTETRDYLGDYVLLIAHDVLAHPMEYATLCNTLIERSSPSRHNIIIDNGVIEYGEALAVEHLIEVAQLTHALHVVLPDVLKDKDATIALAKDAIPKLLEQSIEPLLVPQGSTVQELVECVDVLRSLRSPTSPYSCWGVPRWISNDLGSRIPIVQYINQRCMKPWIHILGTSRNISDDLRCTKLPNVHGIDSANPIVLALNGYHLGRDAWTHIDRGDYWDRTDITAAEILDSAPVLSNIEFMRRAIG